MKAEISMRELWMNPSMRRFFFRKQAEDTLRLLVAGSKDWFATLDEIERQFEDLDELEEFLYNEPDEDIINRLGRELFHLEGDEDDE